MKTEATEHPMGRRQQQPLCVSPAGLGHADRLCAADTECQVSEAQETPSPSGKLTDCHEDVLSLLPCALFGDWL